MTEQKTPPKTLAKAIEEHYAAGASESELRTRAMASWRIPRDEALENLATLRQRDPAAFDALTSATRSKVALYMEARAATALQFRWDSTLELALSQRQAGAAFAPELDRDISIYAEARQNAQDHGLLEAARTAAQEGTD